MKPVACGKKTYSTGTLSSSATISAILFSKPSPLSLENGMLAGSAHTRRDMRLTRSLRWPSAACAEPERFAPAKRLSSSATLLLLLLLGAKAGLLVLFRSRRLIGALHGASTREPALRSCLQVDEDVVDIAHDVGVIAQRRHNTLAGGADILASAGHDQQEIRVAHGLHGLDQRRCIGGALASGPVADVALGMIAPEARVGIPVDGAVRANVEGGCAVGSLPLAVLLLLGGLGCRLERQ